MSDAGALELSDRGAKRKGKKKKEKRKEKRKWRAITLR